MNPPPAKPPRARKEIWLIEMLKQDGTPYKSRQVFWDYPHESRALAERHMETLAGYKKGLYRIVKFEEAADE